ncbi:carcinoembryonic antigen-related cell adhesion molecule 4 isoform X2 [Papio anubis]|uniref:carcinoembryonic antigen-related cell adhesion molecule 4 isoform X2 n=2 Tax=Cercopithecinae TaxID=9528 RepID=UPI0004F22BEA|nr:carcinoembryonic antigen-related cell adhesion molecule 4 isoform X2 [Papio anubis]
MYTEEKGEGGTKKGRNERGGGRGVTWAEPRLCPWPWEVLLPWRRLSTEGGRSADLTVTAALTRAFLEPKLPSTEDKQAAKTMGPPSAAPHGGHRPWQGFLITASLLTFWDLPPTVQFTIEALPSSAAEGKDVLLRACNISETIQAYYWHKGKTAEGSPLIAGYLIDVQVNIPGTAYSGRETIYSNGSLLFQNVTLEDAGSYTLRTINAKYDSDQATGQLHVHQNNVPGLPVGAVAGIVTGVLVGVALVAALVCFLLLARTGRASIRRDLREQRPPASTPGHGPSHRSAFSAPLPGPRTATPLYEVSVGHGCSGPTGPKGPRIYSQQHLAEL